MRQEVVIGKQRPGTKKFAGYLACLLLAVLVLTSACSGKGNNGEAETAAPSTGAAASGSESPAASASASDAPSELPSVELTYYYPATIQNLKDVELVQAEMNNILREKINVTIKLMPQDWGAFDQKMNVMMGAGEAFDLMFTAPWANNYFQNVSRGALLPLDDLLDQYAPNFKASVPPLVWDATKVNGQIYGAINYQIVSMPYGTGVETRHIDKYGVDLDSIKKYEDLEPYLAAWEEAYPPMNYAKDDADPFTRQPPYFGMDSIGDDASVGWVRLDDPALQVFNQYESPEFKQFVELMHKWYEAGYFPKDAGLHTVAERAADMKAGKGPFFSLGSPIKPGVESDVKNAFGVEQKFKTLSQALITTNRAIATMTGISATSKHPERAMMFLELINTDKALYNLLCFGIEGTHYKKVADNVIEKTGDNAYNPDTDWLFGNQFNAYYTSPVAVGNWEKTIALNNEAATSPLLGFSFDAEPVKAELTQTNAAFAQYKDALLSGTADPATTLPEFLDKLKQAGADKIVAEKQRQVTEWQNSKS